MTLTKTSPRFGKVLTAKPNWRSAVEETYSYKTRVWASRDMTEQRVAQRANPRVSIAYRTDASGGRARQVYREIQEQHNDVPSILPVRWRKVTAQEITLGDTEITLDETAPWWMVAGGWVVIESDDGVEAAEVASVSGTTLTLTAGTQTAHTGAVKVCWGLSGFESERRRLRSIVSTHMGATMQFDAKPGSMGGAIPTFSGDLAFLGDAPVFQMMPNWVDDVQLDLEDMREQVDFGYGVSEEYFYNQFAKITMSWTFTALTRQKADDLIAFFCRQRGKQKPFWAHTFKQDFELTATAAEGTSTLSVVGDHTAFDGDETHRGVMVRWPDGAMQINTISSAGDGTLSFDYAWARDVDSTAVISWAFLACFSSDDLDVEWQTDGVAQISIGVSSVKDSGDISIGGPSPLQVNFTYGGFQVGIWNGAETGWAQIDLGYEITEEDIAAGRGRASADYSGIFNWAPGLPEYSGRVNVGFYDSLGVGLAAPDELNWTFRGDRNPEPQLTPFDVSFPAVSVPVRTRYIRFGGITNQGTQQVVGTGYVTIFRDAGGTLL